MFFLYNKAYIAVSEDTTIQDCSLDYSRKVNKEVWWPARSVPHTRRLQCTRDLSARPCSRNSTFHTAFHFLSKQVVLNGALNEPAPSTVLFLYSPLSFRFVSPIFACLSVVCYKRISTITNFAIARCANTVQFKSLKYIFLILHIYWLDITININYNDPDFLKGPTGTLTQIELLVANQNLMPLCNM